MSWTSKSKDISITSTTDHPSRKAGVVARPPGVSTISFTPAEFFGAAARCCHLHTINPALVTPESAMIRALVEQHVDDNKNAFAVESSVDNFKDYVKSYFAGTIASGLAYLAMIKDGYTWSDHFENIGGGDPKVKRKPDFVFARHAQPDVALVESKGTRSDTSTGFDSTVNDGYVGQVDPHLGYTVGTSTASHGYCIGSYLKSSTKGELNVHYTDVVAATSAGAPGGGPGTNAAVQLNNYATVFRLAHSESLARQIRGGRIEDETIPFSSFEWLGRKWITAPTAGLGLDDLSMIFAVMGSRGWLLDGVPTTGGAPRFAVDSSYATTIFRALSDAPMSHELGFNLAPYSHELRFNADRQTNGSAAIFPDGLAVFLRGNTMDKTQPMLWLRDKGEFVPAEFWQSSDSEEKSQGYLADD